MSMCEEQCDAQRWRPTASQQNLQARAGLLALIRQFFFERKVLEVETPLLSSAIGTDLNLSPFELSVYQQRMFLQTSPEFAMKRLLANGSGPIYQICKAFRLGEAGAKHNPEFSMLEWYRPGMSMNELMDELEILVVAALFPKASIDSGSVVQPFVRISYRELFQKHFGIDPHKVSLIEIKAIAKQATVSEFSSESIDTWLDLLFSHVVEPKLQMPTFIYHYPKSQAALARISTDSSGCEIAQRFELVCQGVELANGYFELTDPGEQSERFESEQRQRQQAGLTSFPIDLNLLAALENGLPNCAGVALGIDRLLMLMLQTNSISDVLAFPFDRA